MHNLFFGILLFSTSICSQQDPELLYQSKDLTPEHVFTAGIEGPATDGNGNLYVVNFEKSGTIGVVSENGKARLLVELPPGSTGNGIRLNKDGDLLIADYTGHNILRVNPDSKQVSIYAHHPEMNQPNDLTIMKNQILFLSDPDWKNGTGNLWRVNQDGSIDLLESNMGTTNGVEVSPDEKTLYVNESVQRNVWAYDLSEQGEISNKRIFKTFKDHGMDGMRCDQKGNLYITRYGKGTVVMLDPSGNIVEEVHLTGKKTSNVAFGGIDGRTCFVTLQDRGCVEQFRVPYPGREWSWRNE